MRQRGPKSEASKLAIVPVRDRDGRPNPPPHLTPDEAGLWRMYVESLPPNWFRNESHAVLAELCQVIIASRRVSAELSGMKSLSRATAFDRFVQLTRMKTNYSEVIARISTKLRLVHQSRMSDRQALNAATQPSVKPWDLANGAGDDGDDDGGDDSGQPDDGGERPDPPGPPDWGHPPRS